MTCTFCETPIPFNRRTVLVVGDWHCDCGKCEDKSVVRLEVHCPFCDEVYVGFLGDSCFASDRLMFHMAAREDENV
jgi:hypothetical protein